MITKYLSGSAYTITDLYTLGGKIIYASVFAPPEDIKKLLRIFSHRKNANFFDFHSIYIKEYYIITEYAEEYGRLILALKPVKRQINNSYIFPFFLKEPLTRDQLGGNTDEYPQELIDTFYAYIKDLTGVPCLKEWCSYIIKHVSYRNLMSVSKYINTNNGIFCYILGINEDAIIQEISEGLKQKHIYITKHSNTETDLVSQELKATDTLDSYINTFSAELTDKIQSSFNPLYNPKTEAPDKKIETFNNLMQIRTDMKAFGAQKSVMTAVSRNLNINRSTIIVGNMGTGKTLMSIGSIFAHTKKKYISSIVLCPGHLVKKWQREINHLYPQSHTVICSDMDMFVSQIQPILDLPNRQYNLFIIMSKETARGGYELSPAPYVKKELIRGHIRYICRCPKCGKQLTKNQSDFRKRKMVRQYYDEDTGMRWQSRIDDKNNAFCPYCHEPLWQPATGKNNPWIKFTDYGWVYKPIIPDLINGISPKYSNTNKEENALDAGLAQWQQAPESIVQVKSRRCSLAKYIYQRYRNKIDYLIADEVHQYAAATSQQGQVLSTLVRTAKHTLGLTGTLMNGYAENLFYLLYRICPRMMTKAGYSYSSHGKFADEFGVIREDILRAGEHGYNRQTKRKRLPGVSPLVFTDFLLDICVFVSLEDMSENLPPYTEIPYGIEMEEDLIKNYTDIKTNIRKMMQENVQNAQERQRLLLNIVQLLSIYPDQPYDMAPLYNYKENKVEAEIPEADMSNGRILNKEAETLKIVQQAVNRGEHVLIYYQWTNKTEVAERLKKLCIDSGFNADILTASVSAKKREEWIQKRVADGIQVLICNPALVETGLDLLDFTTIIFYQVGYKLVTMRQASRRSRRLNQTHPVTVYYLYYRHTMQQQALAIMAAKLHAAVALEGKFNEEGLAAMDSTTDMLSQLAQTIVDDNEFNVDVKTFEISDDDNNLESRFVSAKSKNVIDPLKTYSTFVEHPKWEKKLPKFDLFEICNW